MASCMSCGSWIPDGQRTCSMCYGDPGHGTDGYYQDWLDRENEQEMERDRERQEEQPHED